MRISSSMTWEEAGESVIRRDQYPWKPSLSGSGLHNSLVAVALDIGDQGVDPLEDLAVLLLPPNVVIPGARPRRASPPGHPARCRHHARAGRSRPVAAGRSPGLRSR